MATKKFMGIDWKSEKGAATVLILSKNKKKFKIEKITYFKNKDLLKQSHAISEHMRDNDVVQAVADIGFGAVQVQYLQKECGDRVKSCYYAKNKDMIKYNTNNWMLTVDRDAFISEALEAIGYPFKTDTELTKSEMHALNYAYIASCGVN
jgi:hypothetical protein